MSSLCSFIINRSKNVRRKKCKVRTTIKVLSLYDLIEFICWTCGCDKFRINTTFGSAKREKSTNGFVFCVCWNPKWRNTMIILEPQLLELQQQKQMSLIFFENSMKCFFRNSTYDWLQFLIYSFKHFVNNERNSELKLSHHFIWMWTRRSFFHSFAAVFFQWTTLNP